MIPIRDSEWRAATPRVTYALIVVNILVFLFMLTLDDRPTHVVFIDNTERAPASQALVEEGVFPRGALPYPISERGEFTLRFGAVPELVTEQIEGRSASQELIESARVDARSGRISQGIDLVLSGLLVFLTPLTAMFLHGGWLHLIGNMLFMWVFADNVEDRLGHWRFALFYLVVGYTAAAAHIWIDSGDLLPMIGASGAISGVLGAYIVLFPRSMVQVLIPIIFLIPAVIPAPLMIGLWFLTNLINGIGSIASDTVGSGGTAWFAHLGGFVAGILLIYPFLVGRWRRPAQAAGPTWHVPSGFGLGFQRIPYRPGRRLIDPPPADAAAPVPLDPDGSLAEAERRRAEIHTLPPARRRGFRLPGFSRLGRSRRRGGVDPYREFSDRDG